MSEQPNSAIARIFTIHGAIAGAGFLVSERHLFTCAHVVEAALGIGADVAEAPEGVITLDFPLVAPNEKQQARVVAWNPLPYNVMPTNTDDVAVLELILTLPAAVKAAPLDKGKNLQEHDWQAFGFPAGYDQGVWAQGKFSGPREGGWIQLDGSQDRAYSVAQGFSGGPIWDNQQEAIVGMVASVERSSERRAAFMIPTTLLAQAWPALKLKSQPITHRDPYVGLRTFQEEDTEWFFGRGGLTKLLLEKIEQASFLAVLGPSGSGKSSVVLAGVLPALKRGDLPNSEKWLYLTIKPGARPLDTLATALTTLQEGNVQDAIALRTSFISEERALLLCADMLLTEKSDARLVLVVDQFEELWTQAPTEIEARQAFNKQEQQPFIKQLLTASQAPSTSLLLILTMRADFLHRAAEHRDLARLIGEHDVIVSPMQTEELRDAITMPADKAGGRFEAGLVEELIKETIGRQGALPLLEYTLLELWKSKNADGTMTWHAFRQLGGVEGALAARADAILATRYTSAQQNELRHLLLRLIQPGEGAADTRRRALLNDLVPAGSSTESMQLLLKPLVDERLLTTNRDDTTGEETLEVTHEALIRAWPKLEKWLNDAREDLRFHLQLEEAAKEWENKDNNADFLWSGLRLAKTEEWIARAHPLLNQRDERFLQASRATQRRNTLIRRGIIGVFMIFVVALISLGFWATQQEIENQRKLAEQEKNAAATAMVLAEKETNARAQAEEAARNEKQARQDAEEQTNRAELAATQEAIAREEAEEAAKLAQSQALAASARWVSHDDPMQALLLALEAYHLVENPVTFEVLHEQLRLMPLPLFKLGHDKHIYKAQWNTDESQLLTWSEDGTAKLWNAENGQLLFFLKHEDSVFGAQWNKDESSLLTWSKDGTAKAWNAENGQLLFSLEHETWVGGTKWNTDESRLLTWGGDTAKVWEVEKRQLLFELKHEDSVLGAQWIENENRLITLSRDNTVKVWDAAKGHLHFSLEHDFFVNGADWNTNESHLLTWSKDGTAKVWDAQSGQLLFSLEHESNVNGAQWNEDESHLLTWSEDRTAKVWDAQSGQLLFSLEHESNVNGAQWNTDESSLLTWSSDRTAKIWDTQSSQLLFSLEHEELVERAQWNTDESRLLTWGHGSAKIWDAGNSQLLFSLEHEFLDGMQWNMDESRLLTWGGNTAKAWNARNGQLLFSFEHDNSIEKAQWSNDERRMLIWSENSLNNDTVSIWTTESFELLLCSKCKNNHKEIIWNTDESRLLTWGGETAKVWEAESGQLLFTVEHEDSVKGGLWNTDESRLLTWSDDGTAKVWETKSGQLLFPLEHKDSVKGAQWNTDESHLLTWSDNGIAKVWEAESGHLLLTIEHEDSVKGALWNSDESRLLTWGGRTAKVWEAESGHLLFTFEHGYFIEGVQWNDYESYLLTWGDKIAKIWDAGNGQLLFPLEHDGTLEGVQWKKDESNLLTWGDNRLLVWDAGNEQNSILYLVLEPFTKGLRWNSDESRLLTWTFGKAEVWDLEKGQFLFSLEHEGAVDGALWNTDENRLLTWGANGTVKVWDAKTGNWLFTLTGDGTSINEIRWNANQNQIMFVTDRGKLFRYYTQRDKLLDEGCKRATRNLSWSEWSFYFTQQTYRKTCKNLSADSTALLLLREESIGLVEEGNVDEGIAKFEELLALKPTSEVDPKVEAQQFAVQILVEGGQELAKKGDIEGAVVKFQEVLELEPSLDIELSNTLCSLGAVSAFYPTRRSVRRHQSKYLMSSSTVSLD